MLMHFHAFPCISIGFCSVPSKNLARIITGVGMGGEYPLASSHSAESSEDAGDGARNVALLYLFGSGGGQALCPLVTYLMDVTGVPEHLLWRWIFAVGSILPVGQHIALLWFTFATFVVGKCRELWTVDVVWLDGGCYIYIYMHIYLHLLDAVYRPSCWKDTFQLWSLLTSMNGCLRSFERIFMATHGYLCPCL